jgi:hypothetical protein
MRVIGGKPGFRSFQVTPDLLSLGWVSQNKKGDKTRGIPHNTLFMLHLYLLDGCIA